MPSERSFSGFTPSTGFPPGTARWQPIPSIYIQRERRQDDRNNQTLQRLSQPLDRRRVKRRQAPGEGTEEGLDYPILSSKILKYKIHRWRRFSASDGSIQSSMDEG